MNRRGVSPEPPDLIHLLRSVLICLLVGLGITAHAREPVAARTGGDAFSPLLDASGNRLLIGVNFSIPPYVIRETGQGIELEILRQAFAVTGLTVQIRFLPLIRTYTQLKAGMIDGAINIKEGVIDNVFYSDEVITFRNCAVSLAKKNYPDFTDPSFLKGKYVLAFQRAPTILGGAFAGITANNDRYEEVAQQERQVFRLFLERNADFIIMEKQIFNFYRKKALNHSAIGPKAALPVRFHTLFPPTRHRFAFLNPAVRDAFNLGLATIRANKTYARIMQKYAHLMSSD